MHSCDLDGAIRQPLPANDPHCEKKVGGEPFDARSIRRPFLCNYRITQNQTVTWQNLANRVPTLGKSIEMNFFQNTFLHRSSVRIDRFDA